MNTNDQIELCAVPRWTHLKSQLTNLDFKAFIDLAAKDDLSVLLDVRTKEEFKSGTISNAQNLNYLSLHLADDIENLDNSKNYYIFCRTGRRSLRVCMLLKNIGLTVYNLDKGLIDSPIAV